MRKIACSILAAVALVSIGGCGRATKAKDLMSSIKANSQEITDIDAGSITPPVADFSVELLKRCADGQNNVMVSPASVISALAMTFNGAEEDTLKQFENTVCGCDIDEFNNFFGNYMRSLTDDRAVTFDNANAIWIREGLEVKKDFLQKNADYYGAGVFTAPFDDSTVKDINKWVKDNTGGLIEDIVDELNPETVMCLVNAVYFDAKWEEPYTEEQVRDGDFTDISGNTKKVKMMHSSDTMGYIHGDDVTGFIKPYEGNYSFVALLPDEDVNVNDFIDGFSGDEFAKLIESKKNATVIASLPEFSYDYDKSLKDVLMAMGINDAFGEAADFTGITESENLFISEVLHKTHIDVNTDGTKAAAATAVMMDNGIAMIEENEVYYVNLDRPFVYAIVDNNNYLPVFMGVLYSID